MNIMKWKGLDVDPMIIRESVITKPDISQIETNFNESTQESGITVLYPRIEAIHAGRTRNFNHYTAEKLKGDYELKSGVYSWTQPYPKPVIHNHDVETEATGRVHSATFTEFTAAGRPGIMVTPKISQEKAIKDILEGRLLTVSIGATTNAAVCSICGTDIINEGFCGHMRGEEYEGQTAEWIAGDLWFDELSWVNVPADPDAMVIGSGMTNNAMVTGENTSTTKIDAGTISATSISASAISVSGTNPGSISIANIKTGITDSANTTLTGEDGVVKSVSESTEKEEENVEVTDQNPEVTPENTPDATTEAPEAGTLDTTTEEVKQEEAEQTPESTQEETPAAENTTTEATTTEEAPAAPAEEAPVVTEDVAAQLAKAQADLKDALDTIDQLKDANLQLAKAQQESAVGFLVDLRMAIGKESSREEAVEKFASRSLESLNDSIADILVEKPAIGTTRTVETVVKPDGVSIAESKTLATEQVKVISNEDAILSLLRGK